MSAGESGRRTGEAGAVVAGDGGDAGHPGTATGGSGGGEDSDPPATSRCPSLQGATTEVIQACQLLAFSQVGRYPTPFNFAGATRLVERIRTLSEDNQRYERGEIDAVEMQTRLDEHDAVCLTVSGVRCFDIVFGGH
jgi:hypothetical protein